LAEGEEGGFGFFLDGVFPGPSGVGEEIFEEQGGEEQEEGEEESDADQRVTGVQVEEVADGTAKGEGGGDGEGGEHGEGGDDEDVCGEPFAAAGGAGTENEDETADEGEEREEKGKVIFLENLEKAVFKRRRPNPRTGHIVRQFESVQKFQGKRPGGKTEGKEVQGCKEEVPPEDDLAEAGGGVVAGDVGEDVGVREGGEGLSGERGVDVGHRVLLLRSGLR
jgi:hypothetical protein